MDRRLISPIRTQEPYFLPSLILIACLTLFRIGFVQLFSLSMDEGYYWLWSRYPSLGYYDHPPMVAYVIWLTTSLLGDTELGVRLGAVLFSSGLSWMVYRISTGIFRDSRIGFYTVLLLNSVLIFDLGAVVMTPDTPLGFFWGMTIFSMYKMIQTGSSKWWPIAGVFLGLDLVSKYTAIFLVPCIFLFLLITDQRSWLKRREPYLALLIAFLIFSPVIYWNWKHEWVSFLFQFGHGLNPGSRTPLGNFFNFLGSQFAVLTPFIFLGLVGSCVGLGYHGWTSKNDGLKLLFCTSAPVLLFFFLNSFRTKIEGNWPVCGYFPAIVGSVGVFYFLLERLKTEKQKNLLRISGKLVLVSGLLITGFLHLQAVSTVLPMPNRAKLDQRFYGWPELAKEVDRISTEFSPPPFLFGTRWQVVSLLTFYTEGHKTAYMIDGQNRFPYLEPIDHLVGKDGLYITERSRDQSGRVRPYFKEVRKRSEVSIVRDGELVAVYLIYQCYNYSGGLIRV